jgi:hypothetical protein
MSKGPPTDEHENLYEVAYLLSENVKSDLGMTFNATIYLQDPLVAEKNSKLGLAFISLDWEPGFASGPTSERIAVVDYNADSNELAEPARWSKEEWGFVGLKNQPLDPYEIDTPQFRQVNAWAIVHDVLSVFQHPRVMGRPIPWAFEGNRLIVVPNAGYAQNAFYDRSSKSLQFYRCGSTEKPVYTCLSHDIVAHETGHAILDGIRPFYNEISSIQTSAFHEFIADLTAIITALRLEDVRHVVADESDGDLSKDSVIGDLAEMLGQDLALSVQGSAARPFLRTAHNSETMDYLKNNWSCHHCSKVLTGTMFEVLTRMTWKQRAPESAGGMGNSPREALWNATTHFTRLALRALDYCPSVGIQFIDYARAVLRADKFAFPRDELGYREIICDVFHKRGFCAKGEEEGDICDLEPLVQPFNVEFHRYDINRVSSSRTAAYHFLNMNRDLLQIPANQDIAVVDLYDTDKEVSAGSKLPKEIILEYIWREDLCLKGKRFGRYEGELVQLLCGGTIVFDERGNVLYFVHKPGIEDKNNRKEGKKRQKRLFDYIESLIDAKLIGMEGEAEEKTMDAWKPAVEGKRIGGSLRFEASHRLRHHGKGVD